MPPSQPEAENKALVRDLLTGIWINQDIRVVDDLVAEDVVVTNVSFGVELHGVDQFKETLEMALAGFSDIDISTHRVLAEDDAVVAHWTVEGTHGGPFMGVEPTNKRVEWTNVSFFTCREGRITTYWALSDALGFMRQTGAFPQWSND